MAWIKRFQLIIGNGSEETASGDAIDCTGLAIQFRIMRSNIYGKSRAEFTIWNVSPDNAKQFMRADFSDVTCRAGYSDSDFGLIFAGHVLDAHPEWDGPNMKMVILASPIRANGYTSDDNKDVFIVTAEIEALTARINDLSTKIDQLESFKASTTALETQRTAQIAGLKAQRDSLESQLKLAQANSKKTISSAQIIDYQLGRDFRRIRANSYLSLSFAPGAKMRDVIDAVATTMGIPVSGLDAVTWDLPNGYVQNASLKSILRDINAQLWSHYIEMYIDLKGWIIYDWLTQTVVEESIAAFDQTSGLLGVAPAKLYEYDKERPEVLPPEQTWEVRTVLHPALAPNAIVNVNSTGMEGSAQINGFYLVESVEFIGDTMEGQFEANSVISQRKGQN